MSHCLSNLSISHPMSSQTPRLYNLSSKFPHFQSSPISGRNCPKIAVRALAVDGGRENLDHLQRQNKQQQQQQQQAKKRAAPVAPIGLWDRFPTARTVQQMMETMDRMMEEPLAYNGGWPSPSPATDTVSYGRGRTPWEIKEAETEYKLRFDMPGMTREDVKVWVEEQMLVVKAEKQPKRTTVENDGDEWSAKSYGRYSSRIALPENVEFEKIKAEVKDGVLYIAIPKASKAAKVFDISVQ